ncbi:MAG: hypothetical protein ACREXT_12395 [Gammaproteobacteria bacterium]
MLNAVLIHSGVAGTENYFKDCAEVRYRIERIGDPWSPDFAGDDLVIVPNGANHVALYDARAAIHALLAHGGVLACFCGFFTPWIPGSLWRHDNTKPLQDVRYRLNRDDLALFDGVEVNELTFDAHGISGWWACGHIETAHADNVVLIDNFERVLLIADRRSTKGLIIATASGPLGDPDPSSPAQGTCLLYRNILRAARTHLEAVHA